MGFLGSTSGSIIHAFNFTFSAFAMLAPLIAKPFLRGPQTRIDDKTALNSTYLDDLPEVFDSVNATRSPNTEDAVNRTIYPCLIVS